MPMSELMMQPDSIRQLPEIHSRAPWSQSLPARPPGHSDLRTKSPPRLVKSRVVNSGAVFRVSDVITATPVCMLCRKNLEELWQFTSLDAGREHLGNENVALKRGASSGIRNWNKGGG